MKVNVVVISSRSLFREGLRSLLNDVSGIHLLGVFEGPDQLQAISDPSSVDVFLIDGDSDQDPMELDLKDLLTRENTRLVTVTLQDQDLNIFTRRRVPSASIKDLIQTLKLET